MPTYQKSPHSQSPRPSTTVTPAIGNTVGQEQRTPFFAGWTLLPMRLFLGITFVYAGIQKLTDPQFFHKSTPGYIGNQLIAFAHGSPLHDILMQEAVPHAILLGFAIAFGEIAIGVGTLCGLLFRPAAFFGLMLSLIFFLSVSWHVYPYFYGSDIVFAFCWLFMLLHGPVATGYPALDTWLVTKLFAQKTSGLTAFARILLIGSPDRPQTVMRSGESNSTIDTRASSQQVYAQQHIRAITQRKYETRRSFLLGTITGVTGIVGLGITGFMLNSLFQNGANTSTTPSPRGTDTSTTSGTSTGSSIVIAQVNAVAKNSSTTFTIPSTGDPGVLIHLPNDQFVAYDAICTHAGCVVDYDPTSQHLICPCHGATYDPAQQAEVLAGPTNTPLQAVSIHIDSATGAVTLG
jgi:thiosulfate dehydrogenase [quinone] large subunit